MFSVITPWALGWIAGTALQLHQPQLWAAELYWALGAAAVVLVSWRVSRFWRADWQIPAWQTVAWFALSWVMAFALAGARASHYLQTALNPAFEGRTLQLVGIVANLPQRSEDSLRFRFAVESARELDGTQVQLPPQVLLGWYGHRRQAQVGQSSSDDKLQPPPADLRPGDRWQLAVRLKAPHGHINPHGFDYEL